MPMLHIDMREFSRKAREMGIFANDQLPYAISRSLNDTMFKVVRPDIIGPTWSQAFTVRNRGLPRAAMRVETSTKGKLSAGVFDALGKADLQKHAVGGTKTPRRRVLDIPVPSRVALTARGKRPWASAVIKRTPQRALRVLPKGVFVGEGGRLHMVYAFKGSARLDKRFRFYEAFAAKARLGLAQFFPRHIQAAIRSSFRR
ncbi:MAG: hypothetical protein AB7K67_00955 [Hyphomicrobiaceae bacterium]